MKVELNGRVVTYNIARGNLREQVAKQVGVSADEITDGLVKYDSEKNLVIVDNNADKQYAIYAGLHECICCGPYKGMAPKTSTPAKRCGLIDRMLIKSMPKSEREKYIEKRIEMFEALIEYNLNPSLDKQFRESLKALKSVTTK
ncbi:hypothetical protein IKF03_01445 [Candidatus Saccharibacteria bacterium]|nr:hypothetical protein [Candidatus Saccharibacteria bacterium]